ncbi:hypothetical protein BGZ97_010273 [Linnemannia gamsii]|uniref:Uncharacterized protein n=1 Tax=Linnemannia gamsii TaxID=64522 RepID=A0A9P6QMR5_9FUNG|nr:hypothetical protein BGZ97_010273 [Linnemannia gamsii]
MSHASPSPSVSNETLLHVIQQLTNRLDQLEHRNSRIYDPAPLQDDAPPGARTRIIGTTQATTIRPGADMVKHYLAIVEQNFYTAALADNHKLFTLSDYHYTEGMFSLSNEAKKHDADLATVQTRMAHHTRFYDSFACNILENNWEDLEQGKAMLQFLNTLRIAAANDAAKISQMRSKLYYAALGIKHKPAKEGSILKVEEVAARKAVSDLIRTVYATPTPPKATNNDNRTGKDSVTVL